MSCFSAVPAPWLPLNPNPLPIPPVAAQTLQPMTPISPQVFPTYGATKCWTDSGCGFYMIEFLLLSLNFFLVAHHILPIRIEHEKRSHFHF